MRPDFVCGKQALLIGASEGIGEALAAELLRRGARVAVTARNGERLRSVAARLQQTAASPHAVTWRAFDVTATDAVQQHVAAIAEAGKSIDLLFNCAGYAHAAWFDRADPAQARGMMEVNYFGTVNVCRAVLPYLSPGARIVNFASVAGYLPLPGYTAYCASKFAVVGFSHALRKELWPRGVRVCVVCPPNTNTPGLACENLDKPGELARIEAGIRVLEPEQVARAVLHALPAAPAWIHPSPSCRLVHLLNRWLPWLVDRKTRRTTSP